MYSNKENPVRHRSKSKPRKSSSRPKTPLRNSRLNTHPIPPHPGVTELNAVLSEIALTTVPTNPALSVRCHTTQDHPTLQNPPCNLMELIMLDPHLQAMNSTLERQAQQQKQSTLMESFPNRYKELVSAELALGMLKEEQDESQRQIENLKMLLSKTQEAHQQEVIGLKSEIEEGRHERVAAAEKHSA